MTFDVSSVLGGVNDALVFIYGLILSVRLAGGCENRRQRRMVALACVLSLSVQLALWLLVGAERVRRLYPLVVHLPLVLLLWLGLKKKIGLSLVATCTAYLCCQPPNWGRMAATTATGSVVMGDVIYIGLLFLFLFLYERYFVEAAYSAMTCSHGTLLLFGSLPVFYYIFDYATTVYSHALYEGVRELNEFLPTLLVVFYVIFLSAYYVQMRDRAQAQLERSLLAAERSQSRIEMDALRQKARQTAVYQHDMRHHLNMIESFLSVGDSRKAQDYIRKVYGDVDAITPRRFCENETVNLLCSAFAQRARRMELTFDVEASLPPQLPLSDTELCALLSNGLENAMNAAAQTPPKGNVRLYCGVRLNKLLIEIRNPYAQPPRMDGGVPVSMGGEGHGYGCRSMRDIARQHGGLCRFEAEGGVFTVRIVLPLQTEE